jgi:ATP-dependent Lon protease
LADIPDNVKKGLEIIPVDNVDAVLKTALVKPLTPVEWIEPAEIETPAAKDGEDERGVVTH